MAEPTTNPNTDETAPTTVDVQPRKPRLRRFAVIALIWAVALLLCYALPQILDVVFKGQVRPRQLTPLLDAAVFLLAAAGVYRVLAGSKYTEPGRFFMAGGLMLGFWSLFRALQFWPDVSLDRVAVEAGDFAMAWLALVVIARLRAGWPRVWAWGARVVLLILIPNLVYLGTAVPLPPIYGSLREAVSSSGNAADKTAHFWVALALTLLLTWAGPARKYKIQWTITVGLTMLAAAPAIELFQGTIGRGRELSDALAHGAGTLTALALLLALRLGAFTPPESPNSLEPPDSPESEDPAPPAPTH